MEFAIDEQLGPVHAGRIAVRRDHLDLGGPAEPVLRGDGPDPFGVDGQDRRAEDVGEADSRSASALIVRKAAPAMSSRSSK